MCFDLVSEGWVAISFVSDLLPFCVLCLFPPYFYLFIYLCCFCGKCFFMDSFCYCVFCSRALDVSTMLPVTVSCWCHSYLYLPQWVMWSLVSVPGVQAAHTTYQLSSPSCSARVVQNKIQTQKGSKKRLFILTQTHSMQIFWEIPFIKLQNDT